ncbi:hypothetical protein [Streptomyces sp. NPDC088757]|uniref:hypothetical protein n=1 Tax=Streptomyces sp. NPDC088757 TaxID=3365889 RepID=UPI0038307451
MPQISPRHIADAAAPVAHALSVIEVRGIAVRDVDVQVSYIHRGCVVQVADRSAAHRPAVEAVFMDAFAAAGWGVAYRQLLGGLRMTHPAFVTRLSHS